MTAFTLAEVRKGIWPAPVIEGRFDDGDVVRMSFWSHKDKSLDLEGALRLVTRLQRTRGKKLEHWAIELGGKRATSAHEVVALYSPKRKLRAVIPFDRTKAALARINGEWDNPALLAFGPLSTNTLLDVKAILEGERA